MVVRKAGGPNISKKKNMEEAKKLAEKKKLMMKEEESEDDEMSGEDESDEDEMSDVEEEGSDESGDSEEEDEDDDDDDEGNDSLDDDEGTKITNKSKDLGQLFADKRMNNKTPNKTPAKAANKTPNKSVLQQNSQKKQLESKTLKTPKQQNILQQSPSPKKMDDNLKTPGSVKQQKAASPVKKTSVGMDDDDDDEEDDEEEDEDDDEEEDEDDEEEDDDDDEEEEEDDEDEEEEEEKGIVQELKAEPPAKKPKNDFPTVDLKNSEQQRRKDRDTRSLFVRGFPDTTTEDDIKALSPDIVDVRIPQGKRKKRPGAPSVGFAFVEFSSEQKAEENYSILAKKKLKGKDLFIDFVGEKSKNKPFLDKANQNLNKQKLFVSNIPKEATMEDIGKAFPSAVNMYLNNSGVNKTAQISFDSDDAAADAFKKNSALKIKGNNVVVLYALKNKNHRPKGGFGGGGGGGGGNFPRRKPFQQGQGFKKPFHNQRRPQKRSFAADDDDDDE